MRFIASGGRDLVMVARTHAGVPDTALKRFRRAAASRADRLSRMICANGLSPGAIAARHPEVMRSLGASCALCSSVDRCVRALDDGTAAATCAAFCLNAPILKALAEHAGRAEVSPG